MCVPHGCREVMEHALRLDLCSNRLLSGIYCCSNGLNVQLAFCDDNQR